MYIVKLFTEAEIDIAETCKWYENKRNGLGNEFLTEVNHYLGLIAQNPLHFAIRFSYRHRFAILKKFPYFIVFRIDEEKDFIYVTSVFHTSRNPANF